MKKKIRYTPASIFAACCGAIASAAALTNPITAPASREIGTAASAIAGGIELNDEERSIKDNLDRSIEEAWERIEKDYRLTLYAEDCFAELKREIMGKSTSVDEFVRNTRAKGFEPSIAIVIQSILERHRDVLNRDPEIKWDEIYTEKAAKEMASILVEAVKNAFEDDDQLRLLKTLADSESAIKRKVEDKGDQIVEEIRKSILDAVSPGIQTGQAVLSANPSPKKVFILTSTSNLDDFEIATDSNLQVLREIYVLDEDEDYQVELRDVGTRRKYVSQSRAIDMFIHDVTSPDRMIKAYFDSYLRKYMSGKRHSSVSYDQAKMESFAYVMAEIIKKIICEPKRNLDPERNSKTQLEGYIEQNGVEIFNFLFCIPTLELKEYCDNKGINFSLLCFPRAGYSVIDLGVQIIMDYVAPAFYAALSAMKDNVTENAHVRNLLNYSIGPY